MPDEKTTKAPETAAPDTGPGKAPEQAPQKEPVKAEAVTPKEKPPEQTADKTAGAEKKDAPPVEKTGADKAAGDGRKAAPPVEKAGTEKAPNVSVYNFSEIMAGKQAAEKGKQPEKAAPATEQAAPSPEKGKAPSKPEKAVKKETDKTAEPPKRRGRPPKETQAKAPADKKKPAPAKEAAPKQTSIWKEAKDKTAVGKEKAPTAPAPGKTANKGAAAVLKMEETRMKRPLAYITAAWSGIPEVDMNLATNFCRSAYEAGLAPICPKLYLPLFLNDSVPGEHKDGIDMGRDMSMPSLCSLSAAILWTRT